MERIPADGWEQHVGHVARYQWAAQQMLDGESVNDVACGSGYGAQFFRRAGRYTGYDRTGIPDPRFLRPRAAFEAADLDDPQWLPRAADVALCFETLEHVKDPAQLAGALAATTHRLILVSVPVEPTTHLNAHHLHDFTEADIPPLFRGFRVAEDWAQPSELSHVWRLERTR